MDDNLFVIARVHPLQQISRRTLTPARAAVFETRTHAHRPLIAAVHHRHFVPLLWRLGKLPVNNPLGIPQPPHVPHIPDRKHKPEIGEQQPLHIGTDDRPPPSHERKPSPPISDRLPSGSWEINEDDNPFRVP